MGAKPFPKVFESIKDLNLDQIHSLLKRASYFKSQLDQYRPLEAENKIPYLVATMFLENSTRTKLSFLRGISELGLRQMDFDAKSSSLGKGEDFIQTLHTLKSIGASLCIIRQAQDNFLKELKDSSPLPIINAGDGQNQHPTQALLDLHCMLQSGFNPKGKTLCVLGDCRHSRVANSLFDLLPQFGCKLICLGPKEFEPKNRKVEFTDNFNKTIKKVDGVYLLRVQMERHHNLNFNKEIYHERFGLSKQKLDQLNPKALVFHPGPANIGIEIDKALINDDRYQGHNQAAHGVSIRMAILETSLKDNI